MLVSVILAHPDRESLNYSIASTASERLEENGHEAIFHDLYAEGFDPVLTLGEIPKGAPTSPRLRPYLEEASNSDGFVIVHPNWWGQPPAIMKGWVDRVLRPGVAYEFAEGDGGEGVPIGLLKARAALVFNTSNTPPERERTSFGDPLQRIWKDCVFGLCGVRGFERRMFGVVVTSSQEQRKKWLCEVRDLVDKYFPSA